ncbi:MAG TPA: DUF4230 domain-containing protein [Saprospiraceae bacterium]|nr:DUF4230 domain-containing protein [Saprospiraceae bacterium]
MKRIFTYAFLFLAGLIIGLLLLWRTEKNYQSEQISLITNGIKNVQKLVVKEAFFSEVYNYQDADKYFFETLEFQKRAILLVEAKVQVSYDLQQMQVVIDSVHRKVLIKKIPKAEVSITPKFQYYDLQQSMWNTFSKDDLKTIQESSIDKLVNQVAVAKVKEQAHQQLLQTLQNLFQVTQLVGWTVEDQTQDSFFQNFAFKDFIE